MGRSIGKCSCGGSYGCYLSSARSKSWFQVAVSDLKSRVSCYGENMIHDRRNKTFDLLAWRQWYSSVQAGSTGQLFLESAMSLMCIWVYFSCRYLCVEDDFGFTLSLLLH